MQLTTTKFRIYQVRCTYYLSSILSFFLDGQFRGDVVILVILKTMVSYNPTSLTPSLVTEVPVLSQESEWSECICVLGISVRKVSRSCICVLGISVRKVSRSCICVLGISVRKVSRSCICVLGISVRKVSGSCICVLGISVRKVSGSYICVLGISVRKVNGHVYVC